MLRLNTAWDPPHSDISFKAFGGPHIGAGLGYHILIKDPIQRLPIQISLERFSGLGYRFIDGFPLGAQRTGIDGHFPRARPVGLPFL
jgi:hypothetical protein